MRKFIDKQSKTKTPLLIKIVVVIQIWFLLSGLTTTLPKSTGFLALTSLLAVAAQIIALIAIWNLRKWGIIVFAAMSVLGFFISFTTFEMSAKVIVALVFFRGIVIIPALIYWRLMT